jgi:Lrp/AsnC family transcriptional regulator for asnA, asnC and gidA
MDGIDQLILRRLQEDGRTSFTTIAAQARVSETTIRARYRHLLEQGIVRTVGVVDPYALGFQAPAILGIQVEPGEIDRAARAIAALPEVSYVVMTLGAFDIFVEVFCRDMPHLTQVVTQVIQLIPGVRRTETLMISRSYKLAYRWSLVLDQDLEAPTMEMATE